MIVTPDAWNRDNQYFEARFEKTKATTCIGIDNVRPIKNDEPIFDSRDNLQVGRDEEIRVDGNQMFRRTKGGDWRKTDQIGNFFRASSSRPSDILTPIWKNVKRSKAKKHQRWILEFGKIIDSNADILATTQVEENRIALEKLRDAELRQTKKKEHLLKRRKKRFTNVPVTDDSLIVVPQTSNGTDVTATATPIASEVAIVTSNDAGNVPNDVVATAPFKFVRSTPVMPLPPVFDPIPDDGARNMFGDDAVTQWVNRGRKTLPATMEMATIEPGGRVDPLGFDTSEAKCDIVDNVYDSGGMHDTHIVHELNASLAKYTPYICCEDNSSRHVRSVGNNGPTVHQIKALKQRTTVNPPMDQLSVTTQCHGCHLEAYISFSCDICQHDLCRD